MDITWTPTFSKAALPSGCGCDVKTEIEGQGTDVPWPSVFYFLYTCTPLHKAVENFQYDVLLTGHTFRFSHFLQLGWESSSCPWHHASGSLFQKARFHKIAIFIDNPDQMCYTTQKQATERGIAAWPAVNWALRLKCWLYTQKNGSGFPKNPAGGCFSAGYSFRSEPACFLHY